MTAHVIDDAGRSDVTKMLADACRQKIKDSSPDVFGKETNARCIAELAEVIARYPTARAAVINDVALTLLSIAGIDPEDMVTRVTVGTMH